MKNTLQKLQQTASGGALLTRLGTLSLVLFVASVAAMVLLATPAAKAASFTWSTAPTTTNWSGAANWAGNAAPVGGSSLVFSNSSITILNDDIAAGTAFAGITFTTNASAYTISGNSIALSGGLTNNSTNNEILNNALTIAATNTVTLGNTNSGITLGGVISGAGGLTLAGTGSLTLNGNNTYTGNTILNSGTVVANNGGAFGTGTLTFASNSTVLNATTNKVTLNNNVVLASGAVGAFTIVAAPGATQPNELVIVGTITGAGTLSLGSSTNSEVTLNPGTSNTYTGGTLFNGGEVQFGLSGGNDFGSGTMTYANGNTLMRPISSGISITNAIVLNAGAGGTLTNPVDGWPFTLSGNISGAGSLTVSGLDAGVTTTLSGSNSFSGPTIVAVGTLQAGSTNALSSNSVLSISNGAALSIANFKSTVAGLNGGGTVALGSASITIADATNTSSSYGGTISGAGALILSGTGTQSFTGSNAYTGGTFISSGTVGLGTNTALGTNILTYTGNATLLALTNLTLTNNSVISTGVTATLNNGGNSLTRTGVIAGAGTLSIAGSGTTTLTASNTYTGGTILSSGTLAISSNSAISTGGVTIANGTLAANTNLTITNAEVLTGTGGLSNGGYTLTNSGNITGAGALTLSGSGTTVLAGAADTYSGGTIINGGTVAPTTGSGLGTGTVTFASNSAVVNATTGTFTLNNNFVIASNAVGAFGAGTGTAPTKEIVIGGIISGPGAVSLSAGTNAEVTLNPGGNNTYSGGTLLNGGAVQFVGNGLNDFGTGTITAVSNNTLLRPLVSGDSITNATVLNAGAGVTLTNPTDANVFTYAGNISGAGSLTISSVDATTASTLTGSNSFSGPTTIAVGILQASSTNALSSNSVLAISNAGTLSIANFNNTVAGLNGGGTVALGSATLTIAGASNTSSSYGGAIGGTGGLAVVGASTQTLTGTNTYSGGTTLSGGGLSITNGAALGSGSLTVSGGVLSLGTATITNTLGPVTGGTITGGTFVNNGGTYSLGSGTISSVLAGTDGVNKTGTGTVTLTASNSYSGGTSLGGGVVVVATNGALGSGTVTFTANSTISDTAGTDTISNALVLNTGVTGTINDPNTNGNVTVSGVVSGPGNLAVSGPGPVTITAPETYTGTTYVTSGSLVLGTNASIAGSPVIVLGTSTSTGTLNIVNQPNFTIATNQTLAGINGLVTNGSATLINRGTISPGVGTTNGILSVTGSLTNAASAVTIMKVTSTGTPGVAYDNITVGGTYTFGGTYDFVLNAGVIGSFNLFTAGTYAAKPAQVALTGSWNPGSFTNAGGGDLWTFNQPNQYPVSFNDLTGVLTVAVPEPSTWALIGVSMFVALLFRRKFSRKGENAA